LHERTLHFLIAGGNGFAQQTENEVAIKEHHLTQWMQLMVFKHYYCSAEGSHALF